MMAAWEKRGLSDEVFNMCETTAAFAYVDDTHVGVDRNAPSKDLPKPPSAKGSDSREAGQWKGKGKGKSTGWKAETDWNTSSWYGDQWKGNHSAHSSTWNGDWKTG